jgi:putative ABC transport system permease protein
VLIGHDEAQHLFGAQAAGFDALQVVNAGSASQQRVAAAATTYGLQVTSVDDIRAAAQRSISHSIELLSSLSWLAILVAMLAVVNTVLVNVQHGRRELALLRAVGMSSRVARRLVITEAALLALIGAAIGVALGCVIALPLLRASASSGFDPQFVFPFGAAIAAAVAVVAGSAVAAAIPARAAARASIVSALPRE